MPTIDQEQSYENSVIQTNSTILTDNTYNLGLNILNASGGDSSYCDEINQLKKSKALKFLVEGILKEVQGIKDTPKLKDLLYRMITDPTNMSDQLIKNSKWRQ